MEKSGGEDSGRRFDFATSAPERSVGWLADGSDGVGVEAVAWPAQREQGSRPRATGDGGEAREGDTHDAVETGLERWDIQTAFLITRPS
jgi:hypothetical protein